MTSNRSRPARPRRWGRLLAVMAGLFLLGGLAGSVAFYFTFLADLPDPRSIADYEPKLASTVYSQDDEPIGEFYKERRRLVEYPEIPKHVVDAFVAAEDSKFFEHEGRRLPGHPARGLGEPDGGRRDPPGRQHDHPADGEEPAAHARTQLPPQGARDDPRPPDRAALHEAGDPVPLPEPDLLRKRRLWHPRSGPQLLRQGRLGPLDLRGRPAGGPAQGSLALLALPQPRPRRAPTALRAGPDEEGRHDQRGAARRVLGEAPRLHQRLEGRCLRHRRLLHRRSAALPLRRARGHRRSRGRPADRDHSRSREAGRRRRRGEEGPRSPRPAQRLPRRAAQGRGGRDRRRASEARQGERPRSARRGEGPTGRVPGLRGARRGRNRGRRGVRPPRRARRAAVLAGGRDRGGQEGEAGARRPRRRRGGPRLPRRRRLGRDR